MLVAPTSLSKDDLEKADKYLKKARRMSRSDTRVPDCPFYLKPRKAKLKRPAEHGGA